MDNRSLKEAFSELSTPLITDACMRLGVFMRVAPIGIKPLVAGWKMAGRVLPVRHRVRIVGYRLASETFSFRYKT